MSELRGLIASATGHRPNKLGGYGEDVQKRLFYLACDFLKINSPMKVISGMALGWDMAWARAAIYLGIPVIAAVPFYGQEAMWPEESQKKYKDTLNKCKDVIYVCDKGYAAWKMQVRNEYMVDHSDIVIALWNGTNGGTGNCVKYAEKQNKQIINLWSKYML